MFKSRLYLLNVCVFNPRRACAAKVTVLLLYVCLCGDFLKNCKLRPEKQANELISIGLRNPSDHHLEAGLTKKGVARINKQCFHAFLATCMRV